MPKLAVHLPISRPPVRCYGDRKKAFPNTVEINRRPCCNVCASNLYYLGSSEWFGIVIGDSNAGQGDPWSCMMSWNLWDYRRGAQALRWSRGRTRQLQKHYRSHYLASLPDNRRDQRLILSRYAPEMKQNKRANAVIRSSRPPEVSRIGRNRRDNVLFVVAARHLRHSFRGGHSPS